MAWMDVEIFEALLLAGITEQKAIKCAITLYEAVMGCQGRTKARGEQPERGSEERAAAAASSRSDLATLKSDMGITMWMTAASLLLTFITFLKVFSN